MANAPVSNLSPQLYIPRLQQEQNPTATDLRAVQTWGQLIPSTCWTSPLVGSLPPAAVSPQYIDLTYSTSAVTTAGGLVTITFQSAIGFKFAYGYTPTTQSGDASNACTMIVPVLASCSLTQLQVKCYSNTGSVINAGTVYVVARLLGA